MGRKRTGIQYFLCTAALKLTAYETDAATGAAPQGQFDPSEMGGRMPGGFGMGSGETKLQYIDDNPDSYTTIFSSAKTGGTSYHNVVHCINL